MLENRGCYERQQVIDLYFSNCNDSITAEDILKSDIKLKDKYWFFCQKIFSREQNQLISIEVAESVLPIYEARHRNNTAPRKAIESAKKYLAGEITLSELLDARRAAAAAANAAYAVFAAAAAAVANAAYAAAAAAAADAANAANAAYAVFAAAAAADADAAAYKNKLIEILKATVDNTAE